MKKIWIAFLAMATCGLLVAATPVRFTAHKVLPAGWQVASIQTAQFPYGFLEQKEVGGLEIHLTGSQQVPDKGQERTLESITIWFMPVTYRATPVPPPGTPHMPAELIGKTSGFHLFALPWNTTPTWKTWRRDILKHYKIKVDSNKSVDRYDSNRAASRPGLNRGSH